jgi:hypothetical protein
VTSETLAAISRYMKGLMGTTTTEDFIRKSTGRLSHPDHPSCDSKTPPLLLALGTLSGCFESLSKHVCAPRPFPLLVELGSWEEKRLRVEPEVSDERAQSLGINVRVARGCCDALMAQERLDIAQVGSALSFSRATGFTSGRSSRQKRSPREFGAELAIPRTTERKDHHEHSNYGS